MLLTGGVVFTTEVPVEVSAESHDVGLCRSRGQDGGCASATGRTAGCASALRVSASGRTAASGNVNAIATPATTITAQGVAARRFKEGFRRATRRCSRCDGWAIARIGDCSRSSSAKGTRHGEKFLGVACARGAESNDRVVAGMFALAAETARCEPENRIEPVDRASRVGQHLNDPVVSLNVRQFVRQNHADTVIRPALRIPGKKNAWRHDSPGAEKRNGTVLKQTNRPPYTQAASNLFSERGPPRIFDGLSADRDPGEPAGAIQQKQDSCSCARDPQSDRDCRTTPRGPVTSGAVQGPARPALSARKAA